MRDIVSDEDEPCRKKGRVPQNNQRRGLARTRRPFLSYGGRREASKMAPHRLRLCSCRASAPGQTRLASVYESTA